MFPKQKIKASLTKKIVPISLCAVITTAALQPPVFVYASQPAVQHTLADFINSYMAVYGGTGNVNAASQSYMATNSVMQAPLEDFVNGTYSVADINGACSGEAGVARWTSSIANNSQQVSVASAYLEEAGIDSYIIDNLTGASVGENLQASIDYYLDHGALKPAFGGQPIENNLVGLAVMQSMADVAYNFDNFLWYAHENGWTDSEITAAMDSGAAFGDLQSAIDYRASANKTITNGTAINTNQTVINNMYVGGQTSSYTEESSSRKRTYYRNTQNGVACILYTENGTSKIEYFNYKNSTAGNYKQVTLEYNKDNGRTTESVSSGSYGYNSHNYIIPLGIDGAWNTYNAIGFINIGDISNRDSYINGLKNGTINNQTKSPDIVTPNGQAQGTWTKDANANNRNQFNLNINPNFNPNYDYSVGDSTTINQYVQDTQGAIQEGDSQLDIGGILADFVANLKIAINPNPQPTGSPFPTTIPYPTGIPQPTAVPVEDTIPDQPDQEPKPTNTPEEDEKNKQGMATPDLALKFPFCIPFDIADMFSLFMEQRRAPQFHIVFDLGSWGEYPLDVDLSPWDEVAALVRLLELIVFIVGLIMVARKLIGDQGG